MQSLTSQTDLDTAVPGLLIIDSARWGESNMAIDEALLQNATPHWPIVLRVYRWERPTLSIGHFQRIEDRQLDPRLRDLPWVRRKTGGGAIVHDQELTYSIIIPNRDDKPLKGPSESFYRGIHSAFLDNLRKLGWNAALSGFYTCKSTTKTEREAFLCFMRRSPVDLLVGSNKILGSAQRRSKTGLIQHGSFLLRSATSTPELLGLLDLDVRDGRLRLENSSEDGFQGSQIDAWTDFFVASLKFGVSKLLQVNWRSGKLTDLLEFVENGVACRTQESQL